MNDYIASRLVSDWEQTRDVPLSRLKYYDDFEMFLGESGEFSWRERKRKKGHRHQYLIDIGGRRDHPGQACPTQFPVPKEQIIQYKYHITSQDHNHALKSFQASDLGE